MKSPFRVIAIRLSVRLLLIVCFGMLTCTIFTLNYPNYTFLWNILSLAVLAVGEVFLYVTAWNVGERDRNLVKYNHITYQPKRGFIAGAIAVILPLLLMYALTVNDIMYVKVIYITVIILTPITTGVGYLNGHKLKTIGISIVYKNKKR